MANDVHLTARERELLRLLAAGNNLRQCAKIMTVAPCTANTHAANIRAKTGAPTTVAVAIWAAKNRGEWEREE
jgi:DNA-binding CsgD family transcriptional regulator